MFTGIYFFQVNDLLWLFTVSATNFSHTKTFPQANKILKQEHVFRADIVI